jgi:hypothetical protein
MSDPPKKERGVRTALKTAKRLAAYHTLAFLANLFAGPFWFFEKRRWQLADLLDNQRRGGTHEP